MAGRCSATRRGKYTKKRKAVSMTAYVSTRSGKVDFGGWSTKATAQQTLPTGITQCRPRMHVCMKAYSEREVPIIVTQIMQTE